MKKNETLHIYTRVSTRIQEDDGTSLDTQRDLGVKKAENLEMKSKLWNEGAASSHHEDLLNRPKLMELMNEVENGLVKHLFVFNNDRLSRNEITQQTIKIALQRNGVVLYTKDGQFDLTNPTDKLFKTVLDGIASYDNALRTERSRLGKIEKVKQGYWFGGAPPFGYQIVDKKLELHPEESKWVKKMFRWYYDGKSIIWIKSQLDKNGVLARRGNLFATGSITRLFRNTHHIGHYTWTDRKSGETLTVPCPPIVDKTVWDEIQKRRNAKLSRKQQSNRTRNFYLLRDLMVCDECGSNMSGRIYEPAKNNFYYCPSKQRNWKNGVLPEGKKWKRGKVGQHGCTMVRSLNIPITDQFVWDTVIDTVSNSSILKQGFKEEVLQNKFKGDKENERLIGNLKQKDAALKRRLKQVQSDLADVETDIRLKRLDSDYDGEVFALIRSKLVAELKRVKDGIEQTRITVKELGNQKKWLDWVEKYGDNLRLKNDLSKEDKKDYLEGLIERIGVRLDKETNDHHLDITFRMGLVDDEIQYVDTNDRSVGYTVVEGDKGAEIVISKGEVERMHTEKRVSRRWYSKKKAVGGLMPSHTIQPKASITVE